MMKLRIPPSSLPSTTNPNGPIPSHTLFTRHNYRLLISNPHLPRRKLRMSHSLPTCKRSIHVLYMPLYPRGPRIIPRILLIPKN
uniref:Uncharacterized protein n=1 Tax=Catagonus wagneri TaxID=51154 RepID=A0A8C3VEB0_9CETA